MSKKLPFQHETEDLLKLLEDAHDSGELSELSYRNDIPEFLSKFKIEAGEYYVPTTVLYKLYKTFSKDPVSRMLFSTEISVFVGDLVKHRVRINIPVIKIMTILNNTGKIKNRLANEGLKRHFDAFIKHCNLTRGEKWIEGLVLHELYRNYCIDHKVQKRMHYSLFITFASLYFPVKRVGESQAKWFKINGKAVENINPEQIERARNARKVKSKKSNKQKTTEK